MKQKGKIVVKKAKTSLVLRCCRADMSSKNGFVWPGVGETATAPDWKDNDECGNGLHGWLYGQGDYIASDFATNPDAKWLVVQVEDAAIRILGGKCKFPSGKVVFVGNKSDAADYIVENEPKAKNVAVIGRLQSVSDGGIDVAGDLATLTGGDYATLTGGDYATLTGGYGATLTGGNRATLTGGDYATLTGGDRATLTGGYGATLTGGNRATLTGGDYATLTGGYGATLTGGNRATLTGGYGATLTGGDYATLTGGYGATLTGGDYATLTGGDGAELLFRYWDSKAERYRTKIGYVGEDGIKPNIAYRLNDKHQIVEAT